MRRAMLLTAMLAIGFSSAPAGAAKDYYKWVDEDGVTHYSARPPYNRPSEIVSVTTGERSSVPAASATQNGSSSADGSASETRTAATESEKIKDPLRCENARSNLEVLQNNAKVRMKDEEGNIHYLTQEEKAEKIRESQQAVEESC